MAAECSEELDAFDEPLKDWVELEEAAPLEELLKPEEIPLLEEVEELDELLEAKTISPLP